jgi:glyoxylase-like metal-dependent hydrolase (beta-lactamase superfamily II)
VLHRDDVRAATASVELQPRGSESIELGDGLLMIPTPGHTRGHVVFLYRNKFLFTGDHLAWSPSRGTLTAFPSVAWYSWTRQTESMKKLLDYEFEWVLPGHGDMHQDTAANMRYHLQSCIDWMKARR